MSQTSSDCSTMSRKPSDCMVCENANLASICETCVKSRLDEYNVLLKSLKIHRDSLYLRLSELLEEKGMADDRLCWRVLHNEKLARLRAKLELSTEQLMKGKAKIGMLTGDFRGKYGLLESALSVLERNRVEKLEKLYPRLIYNQSLNHMAIMSHRLNMQSVVIKQICKLFSLQQVNINSGNIDGSSGPYVQICSARLPKGLDPHSVPSNELAAALGYMVQLLSLVVLNLAAPALHISGFAGSCSRIWQRDSYWDARPSSRRYFGCNAISHGKNALLPCNEYVPCSNEYPLFIPRQNYCSNSVESSWLDNFGIISIELEGKPRLDSSGSSSFNYSSASPHSRETHEDLQEGISLLKKSVACITAFGHNSICLDVPPDGPTFEAFVKLLFILTSPKECSAFLLKTARPS